MQLSSSKSRLAALLMLIFLFLPSVGTSQSDYTAQVRGTVTDGTGGMVQHATLTITNDGTAIATVANTDANGQYVFNGLRPAAYSLKVASPGFQQSVKKDIVLAVAQQATLDFVLQPYSSHEEISVTETAPLLDTTGAWLLSIGRKS